MRCETFQVGCEISVNVDDFDLSSSAPNAIGFGQNFNLMDFFKVTMCQSNWQALFSKTCPAMMFSHVWQPIAQGKLQSSPS
jgi:hypothetical protein